MGRLRSDAEHYRISLGHGPGVGVLRWRAWFEGQDDSRKAFNVPRIARGEYEAVGPIAMHTLAFGATACEAACRSLVLCVMGAYVDL